MKVITSFSNTVLKIIMTSVQANKSAVSKYTFACCKCSPIENFGQPITSAAIPDFHASPNAKEQAFWKYGRILEV